MAEVIRMPLMSDTMTEGVISEWLKKKGDYIEPGDILAEVETDKATMELESYNEGTLIYLGAEAGDAVPVNDIIAILGEEGEDVEAILKEEGKKKGEGSKDSGKQEEKEEEAKKEEKEEKKEDEKKEKAKAKEKEEDKPSKGKEPTEPQKSENGRMKVSPLARKMAEDRGIDLKSVKGSGDDGRIVKRDIETYEPSEKGREERTPIKLPEFVGEEQYEEVRVSQMRKTIAKRLAESKFSAPHFYLTITLNMDKVVEARTSMNEISPVKISFNDLVIKAAALALRQHLEVNASWRGDTIRYNKHIHIGMAVAVDEGLVVPVIRFADGKKLSHIAAEAKQLGQKARDRKLQPSDWEGNTFTISNLGMLDIEEFTAIINPPDACILAVGSIRQVPAVVNGEIRPMHQMKVTMSCDHRVVDGATGAKFLQTFKALLEDPYRLLVTEMAVKDVW